MTEVAVRGGRLVLEREVREADLLLQGGRIEAIVDPGAGSADDTVDARGLVVLPGVVDAHVHFNDPGRAEWEGWESGTREAAAGGVTTVSDMPLNSLPPTLDGGSFALKRSAAERGALVDFALWGGLVGDDEAPLVELRDAGAVGVKAFLTDSGVPEFPHLEDEWLAASLGAAANVGLTVAVHAEDHALVSATTRRLRGRGRDRTSWARSRPPEAEGLAIARVGSHASGGRVHIVHVSAADAITRRAGLSFETCPHYLFFTESDVVRVGPALKCAPPIRDEANRERLWQAVLDGRITLVASDHSPCPPALKSRGDADIFAAWGGIAGVGALLPVLLTEGVHRRGLALTRLAELVAGAPARLLGLPEKGRISVGADADLALVDLDREWTLRAEGVHTRGVSPYLGMRFRGAVVATLVRGRIVQKRGAFLERPGYGRFVPSRSERVPLG